MCLRMSNIDKSHSQISPGSFFSPKHLGDIFGADMGQPCHAVGSGNQQTSEILSSLWSRHSTQFQGKNLFPSANYQPLTSLAAIYLHSVLLYPPASFYLSFLQLFQWKIQLWRENSVHYPHH